MQIVLVNAVLAAMVWAALCARHVSLLLGGLATLIIGYVLGHSFWNVDLGPVPLTLDRLALVGLVGVVAMRYRSGQLTLKPLQGADWLLLTFLAIVSISAVTGRGPASPDFVSPMWRLIAAFWMPTVLYFIVRESSLERRSWRLLLMGMVGFGMYLAVTALAEMAGQWSVVFPRYIADPKLGLHFGRSRGPALNSVSLGVYLTVCLWCAWSLRSDVRRGWQVVLWLTLPLMAAGIFFTYTRSTWLGLAGSALVVGWISLPKRWRWPAMTATLAAGLVVTTVCWGQLIGLRREGSAQESQHSVQQRAAFAYVSWQMFQDHPMFGVGLGRFFDRKLPYLADRSQPFELESIRGLQHHNTFLAMLTETGMVGLAAFLALLVAWFRTAWSMLCDAGRPAWVRTQGLLMVAVLVAYLPTALFHDITLLQAEQWLLFMMAGVTAGLSASVVRREDAP